MGLGKALLSAGVSNLGGKLTFAGGQGSKLPTHYDLGAAYDFGEITAVVGAGKWVNEGTTYMDLGVEYRLGPIALRAGYRGDTGTNLALDAQKSGDKALGGITGGLGIKRENWRVDYAAGQSAAEYAWSQRVSLTVAWGGPGPKKTAWAPSSREGYTRQANRSGKGWVK